MHFLPLCASLPGPPRRIRQKKKNLSFFLHLKLQEPSPTKGMKVENQNQIFCTDWVRLPNKNKGFCTRQVCTRALDDSETLRFLFTYLPPPLVCSDPRKESFTRTKYLVLSVYPRHRSAAVYIKQRAPRAEDSARRRGAWRPAVWARRAALRRPGVVRRSWRDPPGRPRGRTLSA